MGARKLAPAPPAPEPAVPLQRDLPCMTSAQVKAANRLVKAAFGSKALLVPPGTKVKLELYGEQAYGIVQPYAMDYCRGEFPVLVGAVTHMLAWDKRMRIQEFPPLDAPGTTRNVYLLP